MVLPLSPDVLDYPGEVLASEADHAVSTLPFEGLVSGSAINLVRGGALQLLHHLTDRKEGFDLNGQVYVRVGAAELVQGEALQAFGLVAQECVGELLNLFLECGVIAFGVPVEVQEDLVEHMAAHGYDPVRGSSEARLKPAVVRSLMEYEFRWPEDHRLKPAALPRRLKPATRNSPSGDSAAPGDRLLQ